MALLSRDLLADATNNEDFRESELYGDAYLGYVFQSVQDEIGSFLKWKPALAQRVGEVGMTTLLDSGVYAGRYDIELKNKPLLTDDATTAIQSLQITYPIALATPSQASLSFCSIFKHIGQLYTLAPGAVEALLGVDFGYGTTRPSVYGTGYIATYYSGFATGVNDPVPNGGGSGATFAPVMNSGQVIGITVTAPGSGYTNAPILVITPTGSGSGCFAFTQIAGGQVTGVTVTATGQSYLTPPLVTISTAPSFNARLLHEDIRTAAILLTRERLAFDNARNLNPNNPMGGFLLSQKSADADERYAFQIRESSQSGKIVGIGAGTPMSQDAERKLSKHVKQRTPALLGR